MGKTNSKQNENHRGGGGNCPLPPPPHPWRRACIHYWQIEGYGLCHAWMSVATMVSWSTLFGNSRSSRIEIRRIMFSYMTIIHNLSDKRGSESLKQILDCYQCKNYSDYLRYMKIIDLTISN